jgi:hypothetical protein
MIRNLIIVIWPAGLKKFISKNYLVVDRVGVAVGEQSPDLH